VLQLPQLQELAASPMRGIAYAQIKHVHMYSCYAPPSDTTDQFEEFLEALVEHARGRSPKIIAGDFNVWAVEWGSRVSNPRGRAVIDVMGMLDLVLLNDGRKPTFNNDRGTSFIDVTFVSRGLVDNNNWMVYDFVTLSDHALISFIPSPEGLPGDGRVEPPGKLGTPGRSMRPCWPIRSIPKWGCRECVGWPYEHAGQPLRRIHAKKK